MDLISGVSEKNRIEKALSKSWKPNGDYIICNQKLANILNEVITKSKNGTRNI